MTPNHFLHRSLSVLLALSMVLTPLAPALHAQDGGSLFLPMVAGGKTPAPLAPGQINLFRTQVSVRTLAQWRDLARTGAVILDRGEDWAVVLVDDVQLADLARWRFTPQDTNSMQTLVAAVRASNAGATAAADFQPLLDQIDAANSVVATDSRASNALRSDIRTAVAALTVEQRAWLVQVASVDTDGDGLTDDQEMMWCTDPARADSDFDGTRDGAEVTSLKRWLNNELSKAPSTGKPFQGWPHQKANCYDDDSDSVPDIAEVFELGLNSNRESTDRDKFDDGQELFGNTYCTGGGGFCGYGALPRNEDWGVIFAEMPSWVKAPGHHPLVAAFPVPEVDIVSSSLRLQPVTVITSEQGEMQQATQSYSTAKTEGTSTSLTDTETWNNWQSVATTTPLGGIAQQAQSRQVRLGIAALALKLREFGLTYLAGEVINCVGEAVTSQTDCWIVAGAKKIFAPRVQERPSIEIPPDATISNDINLDTNAARSALQGCKLNSSGQLECAPTRPVTQGDITSGESTSIYSQDQRTEGSGRNFSATGQSLRINNQIAVSAPLSRQLPTRTVTSGSSWGGSRATTHARYEEHTVTNGEAFSTGANWSTATAINSAHAADLWFTYKVRNTGTEYAREITNLAFNLYIGDDPNPAITYFVAPDIGGAGKFVNFMPNEEHTYTSRRIPLSLEQMKAIDLGGPIRIVVEDFAYGIDELFYQDAANASVVIALEDGTDDGDENIDAYLIPTWGSETVLNVLGRYFPHETDANGMMIAIWTPEYRSDTPAWCRQPRRPTDQPTRVVWCKKVLSTADWWNVYTDGLGDGSEGFQDTPATPGATALFRFNQDSDLDGFSDRTEARLGADPKDASSFPHPEVLAGVHNIQAGARVTSTLSLLNTGLYDAYGVEAVMVAPDDSITIDNNTVGGSGRVKALKEVIVGSRVTLQSPLPAAWMQANHATPTPGGYYTGNVDRTYTFTVNCATAGGCKVGEGSWTLAWNDGKGASGALNYDAGYKSPTFLPVGAFGVTLALYTGNVQHGESFTVAATTPRDTFQYTINRTPHTPPLVIVSYNDPQGNHRFVVPSQAMSLTTPTANLQPFARQMLQEVGVEIVTQQPFAPGANGLQLLVNNPSNATLQNAHLFLEFINITGTVVSEIPVTVTLPPGPTYTPVSFSTSSFSPAFDASQDYIVMAFLTDYQGNILDTAGRPLSSFQADPLPQTAVDVATLTWNFGTVAQGALLKHRLALANVGYGRLYTYLTPTPGLSLSSHADVVGAADLSDYELILRTADLPLGAYDQSATLKTSDPNQPTLTVRVQGTVTAAAGDAPGGLQRPLDVPVTVVGPKSQGEWVDFSHNLGPEPQSLHPVKVYPQDYATLYGVGKYATDFSAGTASYDMFGDGRDGVMPGSGNLDNNNGFGIAIVNSGSVGAMSINVTDAYAGWRINPGDVVLIHQTQGTGAGCWELNKATSDYVGGTATIQMEKPLKCNYASGGNNRSQVLRVPQYSTCNVTGTVTPLYAWNGSTGGIFAVKCTGNWTLSGRVNVTGYGYRGGPRQSCRAEQGTQGEGISGPGGKSRYPNNGGGGGGPGSVDGGAGAGGGSYASAGGDAKDPFYSDPGLGSQLIYGTHDLQTMLFGGAGGAGGTDDSAWECTTQFGGRGGNGGGIVVISARRIEGNGYISANGENGEDHDAKPDSEHGGGGGAAGGSILIHSGYVNIQTIGVSATGGVGGRAKDGSAGNGGVGRIRIEYCESLIGATNPGASTQKLTCYVAEQTEFAPYATGRLNLPETVTTSKTYQVQYARRLTFSTSGSQTTILRVPAGMASTATLQALVSGLPASASFSLDIGNDGSNEWSGTVANASTNSSPDLAAAFNAYWVSQGAPVSGNLDVPVKVTMSQPGQVLLTNLQFSTVGSKQRTLRMSAGAVTQAALDLALSGSGQQAISIAVDVGADGALDWTSSVSTTLPVRLTTGNLAAALTGYLAGKSGLVDVPIRIFVAPDVAVALYDARVTLQPAVDLAAGGLGVGGAVAAGGAEQTGSAAFLEGDVVPVAATLSNPSSQNSGPVTAAFFANAAGWGDWYIGSVFVANIAPGGSVPVSIDWDTTGFSGAVPVKVVVNPYGRTGETSTSNNTATTQVSITPLNPAPEVDFTATPTIGGAPLSVQFTSVVTNTVDTYAWSFGDAQTSTAANPTHLYTAAGVYTVTLTVTGPGGSATKTRTGYITVTSTPAPPVAAFSASPTSGAAPLAVTFTNQSTGTITSYAWSFGDGGTSTAQNPSHTFTTPGVYTVTLTVTGPGGSNTQTRASYITVNHPPPVANFTGNPTSGLAPLTVQFTDASTGTITSRSWNFGDGGTSTAQNPSRTFTTPGVYTVTLNVTGPGGSNTKARTGYITVTHPPPVADFTGSPTSGVAPLTVQFTDASTGTITSRSWSFGDGGTSTAQNPTYTYATPGVYTVMLTVTGPGDSDTKTKTSYITVTEQPNEDPPPVADFTAEPTTGVAPLSVQFTDVSTGTITSHTWSFGDGGTSTTQNPAYTYATPGVYTVTLSVTGPGGSNIKTRASYITVTPSEDPPVASFTATPEHGVAPLIVEFTDTSTGAITAWVWSFGNGGVSSERHPIYTYMTTGVYTVTLTVTGPLGWSSATRSVRVAPPTPAFMHEPAPADGLTMHFTFTPPPGVTHWLWEFGDGATSTAQNPVHTYAAPGNYTVRLTVYGPNGTSSSQEQTVQVRADRPQYRLYLPHVNR